MTTPLEVSTEGLQAAAERLKEAQDRFENWMKTHPDDFTSPGYVCLKSDITEAQQFLLEQQRFVTELSKHETVLNVLKHQALFHSAPLGLPSEHTLNEKLGRGLAEIVEDERKKYRSEQLRSETVSHFYYGQAQGSTIKCMLTNAVTSVRPSHIFLASWDEQTLEENLLGRGLEFEEFDKESPENMLLLHENVAKKNDCGQLLFEYEESSQNVICRILDQRIMKEYVYLNPPTTFGTFDGRALDFPSSARPLIRLIRFRAMVNRETAMLRGYIQANEYSHLVTWDYWSRQRNVFESVNDWISNISNDLKIIAVDEE